jgi:tRNA-specific 2-thiouridylase
VEGRSRKTQIQMAKAIGWKEYPNPSGGCLLAEKGFARRLKDLFQHEAHADQNDIDLLKLGRHLRLNQGSKLVVGRDVLENSEIPALARGNDALIDVEKIPSPIGLLRGVYGEAELVLAASVVARYSDAPKDVTAKVFYRVGSETSGSLSVTPLAAAEVAKYIL